MSARDELAKVIYTSHRGNTQVDLLDNRRLQGSQLAWARLAADTLIASGWSKPRTITTAEELDALPVGSVLNTDTGAWEKVSDPDDADDITFWLQAGNRRWNPSRDVALPATVLHEPETKA